MTLTKAFKAFIPMSLKVRVNYMDNGMFLYEPFFMHVSFVQLNIFLASVCHNFDQRSMLEGQAHTSIGSWNWIIFGQIEAKLVYEIVMSVWPSVRANKLI